MIVPQIESISLDRYGDVEIWITDPRAEGGWTVILGRLLPDGSIVAPDEDHH